MITVFWNVMPCNLVDGYYVYSLLPCSREVADSSDMPVLVLQSVQHYITARVNVYGSVS